MLCGIFKQWAFRRWDRHARKASVHCQGALLTRLLNRRTAGRRIPRSFLGCAFQLYPAFGPLASRRLATSGCYLLFSRAA